MRVTVETMSNDDQKIRARVSQLEATVRRVHALAGRGGLATEALADIERDCEAALPVLLDEAIAAAGTPHRRFKTDDIEAEPPSQGAVAPRAPTAQA